MLLALTLAAPTWAGNLDASAAPTSGSGMPSTADIYNRLNSGAAISVPGTFQEPAAGPTAGTGKTLADIAAKLPAPDNTHGAAAGDVANGKTFWGLRTDGTWGLTRGTQAALTPASGNATAADIRLGKKAYVNGVLVTGTYCPNGWSGPTPPVQSTAISAHPLRATSPRTRACEPSW